MSELLVKVKDMPTSLRQVCLESGFNDEDEMSPRAAVMEWSSWYIGDPSWADSIIYFYEELKADLEQKV